MTGTYPPEGEFASYELYLISVEDNNLVVQRQPSDDLYDFYLDTDAIKRKVEYLLSSNSFRYGTDLNFYSQPDSFHEFLKEKIQLYLNWAEKHLSLVTENGNWTTVDSETFERDIAAVDKWQAITIDIKKFLNAINKRYD